MNWVKKQKLPATEAIKFNGYPCNELDDLWQTLHHFFNSVQDRLINFQLLDEIPLCQQAEWLLFSKVKFIDAINKYSSLSIPGLDHIFWSHLKELVGDAEYVANIVNIVNSCIDFDYWLSYFKNSMSIIILKPNKPLYDISKIFWPIILLNILRKLIEKAISGKLRVHSIALNFIDLN